MVIGQFIRTLAMSTAAASFTHLVSSRRSADHALVTHGIYAYSRHPSYAAFLYWAVGTQVWLGNPVGAVGFGIVLWRFFYFRIKGASVGTPDTECRCAVADVLEWPMVHRRGGLTRPLLWQRLHRLSRPDRDRHTLHPLTWLLPGLFLCVHPARSV